MTSKQDTIIEHLIKIKEDVAGMKQHLKNLNGKIIRQEQEIQDNKEDIKSSKKIIDNINIRNAVWLGGVVVLATLINIVINVKL